MRSETREELKPRLIAMKAQLLAMEADLKAQGVPEAELVEVGRSIWWGFYESSFGLGEPAIPEKLVEWVELLRTRAQLVRTAEARDGREEGG